MESRNPTSEDPDSGIHFGMATAVQGFTEVTVVSGIQSPVAMAFAPDGRVFVCEQRGALRVIKNGSLLSTPFLSLPVDYQGERGLLGVTFDPDFASNRYVYVYYTATSPTVHNRLSRFTASSSNPDVAAAGSETILLELDNLSSATNHNGGALHFGVDGKLYIGVGENANGNNSQSLGNLMGKLLRLNKDGTIPQDNPFYANATGNNRAIWALGLRNPFTFAVQPGTGRIFLNDVGQNSWEEIDDGKAGANYGWPTTEGATGNTAFKSPVHAYDHSSGCAITGGTFYNPPASPYPSQYVGTYFYADYCGGWIKNLNLATGAVTTFATGTGAPTDMAVGTDGNLYYLAGSGGALRKIIYTTSQAPAITSHPSSVTVSQGASATFSVSASGSGPLAYQWRRNGTDIPGATAATYTLSSVQAADSGARFRVNVTNGYGGALSNEAVLSVTSNRPPTAAITAPALGATYMGGQSIAYSGTGTDPEEGNLPGSRFTWRVDFHHDSHAHPFAPATGGSTGGTFTIPVRGETSANVWYRITLTVTDAGGLTSTVYRDIQPVTATVTLASSPSGMIVKLDGQPVTTPYSFTGVAGIIRNLEASTPQTAGGKSWEFASWSDGGAYTHEISTPSTATTYTATFREAGGGGGGGGGGTDVYEAEDAFLAGPVVAANQSGYTGTGFITFTNATGDYVEWTVNAPTAGRYDLDVRYSLDGTAIRSLRFAVNGMTERYSMDYRPTGSLSTWSTVRHSTRLVAGLNKIRATAAGSYGPYIDHLKMALSPIQ